MADKVYVVTLKSRNDLEGFYSDMSSDGFKLHMKRPISRNTQYYMTETQAETLRNDDRVLACELTLDEQGIKPEKFAAQQINNEMHPHVGDFCKNGSPDYDDRDWAKLHMSGNVPSQRQKGNSYSKVYDDVEIFNDGRHVDVVICDDPVSFDCAEWDSDRINPGQSRFVQYDWYNELNSYVQSIDDDGLSSPASNYTNYIDNGSNQEGHGTHVAGTIAGRWYGWAPEANIYSLQVLNGAHFTPVPQLLIFDYLRAFHRNKPINPVTGTRNPTITNHSWGYLKRFETDGFLINDIGSVTFRGTVYSSNNPNPSGWTMVGLEKDFGIGQQKTDYNIHNASINADVEDAIEDGVVVIGAAGNNDFYMCSTEPSDPSYADWNNTVYIVNYGTYYFNRGSSPNNAKGVINVGALGTNGDFRRASYSNFGPRVDIYAPGSAIISAYISGGTFDNKYGGSNWFYNNYGTSMASPQVAGVAACLATGKERFTNSDVIGYIQQNSIKDDMTWNIGGGGLDDPTCDGSQGGMPYFSTINADMSSLNPRKTSGYIDGWYLNTNKGDRRLNGRQQVSYNTLQLFPRSNTLSRPKPGFINWEYTVTAQGMKYVLTGRDRKEVYNAKQSAVINIRRGDQITFNVSAPGHPFWIAITQQAAPTTATTAPGGYLTNNGSSQGEVIWDTTSALVGTYYYNCEYHVGMNGIIFVNE